MDRLDINHFLSLISEDIPFLFVDWGQAREENTTLNPPRAAVLLLHLLLVQDVRRCDRGSFTVSTDALDIRILLKFLVEILHNIFMVGPGDINRYHPTEKLFC